MKARPVYLLDDGKLYYFEDGKYYLVPINANGSGVSAVGGGGGISGLIIEDHGSALPGRYRDLDFEGPGVTVSNSGSGKAVITIPGYVIASLTTAEREALVPTTALIVEDIDLDMYFKWSTVTDSWSPF